MSPNTLTNRIENIEKRLNPYRYQSIEDRLRVVHLRRKGGLMPEEARQMEELEKLNLSPRLARAFREIEERKMEEKSIR